jgi:hypothetical protein
MAVAITIILPRSHSAASSPARTVSRTRLFPARRRPSRMHPREICVRGGGCNSVCMCARAAGTFVALQTYGAAAGKGSKAVRTYLYKQDRTRSVAPHAAAPRLNMSLVLEADSFTHILRIMSTNVDGKRKVWLLAIL